MERLPEHIEVLTETPDTTEQSTEIARPIDANLVVLKAAAVNMLREKRNGNFENLRDLTSRFAEYVADMSRFLGMSQQDTDDLYNICLDLRLFEQADIADAEPIRNEFKQLRLSIHRALGDINEEPQPLLSK